MQFFDGGKARQPERFAGDDDDKRQRGGNGKNQSEIAEAFAAREQVLDQAGDAESEAEQDQSTESALQNIAPQRKPRCTGTSGASTGTGSSDGSASGLTWTVPRDGRLESSGVHHDDAGVVELEGRRPPMMRALAHCSLSPIRNWRARSRRM